MNSNSTISDLIRASTPDYFLGPSSTRYFSSGFKRIDHFIEPIAIKDRQLFADIKISWPDCWSTKNGTLLKPHIGTLDFFLFSIRMIEIYLTDVELKQTDEINQMWVSDFIFKSGCQCIENDKLTMSCQLRSKTIENNQVDYLFEINIMNAKVRLAAFTEQNIGKRLGFVLDGEIITSEVIEQKNTEGRFSIVFTNKSKALKAYESLLVGNKIF